MKFYVCTDEQDLDFDCSFTLNEAKQIVAANTTQGKVKLLNIPITKFAMRDFLGGFGGYAKNMKVYQFNSNAKKQWLSVK
jgi:hypothetical protein